MVKMCIVRFILFSITKYQHFSRCFGMIYKTVCIYLISINLITFCRTTRGNTNPKRTIAWRWWCMISSRLESVTHGWWSYYRAILPFTCTVRLDSGNYIHCWVLKHTWADKLEQTCFLSLSSQHATYGAGFVPTFILCQEKDNSILEWHPA